MRFLAFHHATKVNTVFKVALPCNLSHRIRCGELRAAAPLKRVNCRPCVPRGLIAFTFCTYIHFGCVRRTNECGQLKSLACPMYGQMSPGKAGRNNPPCNNPQPHPRFHTYCNESCRICLRARTYMALAIRPTTSTRPRAQAAAPSSAGPCDGARAGDSDWLRGGYTPATIL